MPSNNFEFVPEDYPTYYGNSDILAQIADELRNNPSSCFAENVRAWYNAEYSALSGVQECEYQIRINQELCEESGNPNVETIEDIVDAIGSFSQGKSRRVVRAAIRIACREARRRNIERTSQDPG